MTKARKPDPEQHERRERDDLTSYLVSLVTSGRGDSARGRNFAVLHFLEVAWTHQGSGGKFPYLPTRNPAAFLVMVFDLIGDHTRSYSLRLEHSQSPALEDIQADIDRRLRGSFGSFLAELEQAHLPTLAKVLGSTVKGALLNPKRSDLPQALRQLRLLMTDAQLAQFEYEAYVHELPLMKVLAYLRFTVPSSNQQKERHPAGGDVRKALRDLYDPVWDRVLAGEDERNSVTLFASLPVDGLRLVDLIDTATGDELERDFAVYYALATDAKRPGRTWEPPQAYVDPREREHFEALVDRGGNAATSLHHLGLSSTFPKTFKSLDGWLTRSTCFPELHAGRPWKPKVVKLADRIAQARARFLYQVGSVLQEVLR